MHYVKARINELIDKKMGLDTWIEQNNFKTAVKQFHICLITIQDKPKLIV